MAQLNFNGTMLEVPDGQLPAKMGIEIIDWTPERMVATMPVAGNLQPYGLMHGGASCVLAETLGSVAAAIHAGPDHAAVGLEISASHHRAARSGVVTAVCTPLHAGRTVATFQIAITDDTDRLLCSVRLTCLIRAAPPASTAPPAS